MTHLTHESGSGRFAWHESGGREIRHHHGHGESGGAPWGRHERAITFGPGWGPHRRARRGDIRAALLAMLDERPMHGYDMIRELRERSGGAWRASPGSVYPTLQLLEDQGLVTSDRADGKRVYSVTEPGRAELAERRERAGNAEPWEHEDAPEAGGWRELRDAVQQVGFAAMQVRRAGGDDQVRRAAEVLTEARKKLYAILQED